MCCALKSYTTSKKRVIALAFLVGFIVVSLLSEMFILTHVNHEHDRNDVHGRCSVCAQIQNAENMLKQIATALKTTAFAFWSLFAITLAASSFNIQTASLTPVALKIRMNN